MWVALFSLARARVFNEAHSIHMSVCHFYKKAKLVPVAMNIVSITDDFKEIGYVNEKPFVELC